MEPARKKFVLFIILFIAFIDVMGIGLVYPMFSTMIFHEEYSILAPEVSEGARGFYLGVLLAIMPLTQFFSSPILGMASDAKGRKIVLLWSLAAGIIGYLLGVLAIHIVNLPLLILSRVAVGVSAGSAAVVSAAPNNKAAGPP